MIRSQELGELHLLPLTSGLLAEHSAWLADIAVESIPGLERGDMIDYIRCLEQQPDGSAMQTKTHYSGVLLDGAGSVGCIVAYERLPDDDDYPDPSLHVGLLALDERVRGRGLGSAMLRAAIGVGLERRRGLVLPGRIDSFTLAVRADSSDLHRFYESHGFVQPTRALRGRSQASPDIMTATRADAMSAHFNGRDWNRSQAGRSKTA